MSLQGKLLSRGSFAIFPVSCSVLVEERLFLFVSLSFSWKTVTIQYPWVPLFIKKTNNNKNKKPKTNVQEADWGLLLSGNQSLNGLDFGLTPTPHPSPSPFCRLFLPLQNLFHSPAQALVQSLLRGRWTKEPGVPLFSSQSGILLSWRPRCLYLGVSANPLKEVLESNQIYPEPLMLFVCLCPPSWAFQCSSISRDPRKLHLPPSHRTTQRHAL